MDPSEKRLAIEVDDHPLEYIDFEGIIPEGMYGAGAVVIWDEGTYEPLVIERDKIEFVIGGTKGRGREKQWLLIKHEDRYASPGWTLETCLTRAKLSGLKERIPPCTFS
jgi:bifunctional non-homologous end joining protein LigD